MPAQRPPAGMPTRVRVVLAAAAAALAPRYGPVELDLVERLTGSDRALTARARLRAARPGAPDTVIVKAPDPAQSGEALVREPAALATLAELAAGDVPALAALPAPALLATGCDPPLLVLVDLGRGASLADALLGTDRVAAAAGLRSWAEAMATLAAATIGSGARFAAALSAHASRLGRPTPGLEDMAGTCDRAAATYAELLPQLGVTPGRAALAELRALPGWLAADPAMSALTPADACPDNNITLGRRHVLLDFEGACVRHVAWDAAYLVVPWPSCWCAWQLGQAERSAALTRWRDVLAPALPAVRTARFEADLALAATGWAALAPAWFLTAALRGHWRKAVNGPGPRPLVQHRFALVAASTDPRLGALTELATEVVAQTRSRWGEHPLELAPAFRAGVAEPQDPQR